MPPVFSVRFGGGRRWVTLVVHVHVPFSARKKNEMTNRREERKKTNILLILFIFQRFYRHSCHLFVLAFAFFCLRY